MKKNLFLLLGAAVLLGASCFSFFVAAAGPMPLASHRAVYDLSLKVSEQGSGIQNVRGRIVMEVENGCEGYVLNQRMLIELSNVEGGTVVSDYHLSTWEDKTGDMMRFTVSNTLNGQSIENHDGVATKDAEKGAVTFKNKEKKSLNLPKDAIFPTEHTLTILKSAKEGKKLISAKIYDGNGIEGLQDSLTVIGKKSAASEEMAKNDVMKNLYYWPVQLSYFDLTEQTNEPDYEIGLSMYENGVATDLILKYKDFSLNGKLVQLDFLGMEVCSKN